MSDPRDYKLEISSLPTDKGHAPPRGVARPWLSALFACCQVYQRIYRDPSGREYRGACPRCGKRVRFRVGPGGTTSRSFLIE
jgi:hypothetical protein